MNSTTSLIPNYNHIFIPVSLTFILIAIIIALIILSLVIFIPRNTSDWSCRWRGYFGYISVVAVIYAYLAQAVSRFLISILSIKYRWASSFSTHRILLFIEWVLVIFIPLPALLTDDIRYRPFSLCWVPKENTRHLTYIIITYYLIPALFIFAIYIYIYLQVKRSKNRLRIHRSHRDLELLRNIIILFAIYIFGALPTLIHMIARVEIFYALGLISVSLAVAIEKFTTLVIDRDFRTVIKNYFRRSISPIS